MACAREARFACVRSLTGAGGVGMLAPGITRRSPGFRVGGTRRTRGPSHMRIHLLAMVALLTAAVATGCSSARDVQDPSTQKNVWGCDQCHGYPPPPFFTQSSDVFPHAKVTGAMCSVCHPNTVGPDGHTLV